MNVRSIMTNKVLTISPELTVQEAAALMADNHTGSVVVMLGGKIQGLVTERDVLKALAEHGDIHTMEAQDIMTRGVYTISAQSTVPAAMALMKEHQIKKLPVFENDRLVGMLTATDILLALPKAIPELGVLLKRV